MKINRVEDLEVFLAAADASSFSAAARALDISPAVASAVIKRLEAGLGTRLFERSTRSLRLSEAGERLLPHARNAIHSLAQAAAALRDDPAQDGALVGPLRLSVPSDFGRNHLVPWIEDYIAQQPGPERVMLELRISDRRSNMLQHPVDFAVRYGALDDSDYIALPLAADNRRVLCAAPAYLARHSRPQKPADLKQHNCLRFMLGGSLYSRWCFEADGEEQTVEVKGDRVADDAAVIREMAVAGHGIVYKSAIDVAANVQRGELEILLPQWRGEAAPVHLVAVSRYQLTPAIRRLAVYLAERCRDLVETGA